MTKYILYKNKKELPNEEEIIKFVSHKSINTTESSGYSYSKGEIFPCYFDFHWAKWIDNPDCPVYTQFSRVSFLFSPLSERDVKYSKKIVEMASSKKYENIILVYQGNAYQNIDKKPAIVDHRIFHRGVYFFAKSVGGIIVDTKDYKLSSPKEYYKQYQKFIEWPFRLKLQPEDYVRF